MEKLRKKGALVSYSDPYVPIFPKTHDYFFDLSSLDITPNNIAIFDCILIATNHDVFDYDLIQENAKLIVDTRGVYRQTESNIVSA